DSRGRRAALDADAAEGQRAADAVGAEAGALGAAETAGAEQIAAAPAAGLGRLVGMSLAPPGDCLRSHLPPNPLRGGRRPQAVWFALDYGVFGHARATQRVGVDGFWGFCGEREELRPGVAKIGASTEGGLGWPVRVVPVSAWWWWRW